ncbi:hypothetical protein LWI29_005983 [Acer saccharum]|uniref:NAC domain-containing protein n=1 Tax=Acer saccharum TaxID=4024 RepID=A0AA39RMU3_ACESA|nr:hypothetical protein LWI29_005983 [Acer saccharum]
MASSSGGVPPGFRFHPTDEELLHYYLRKKISFQKFDMEEDGWVVCRVFKKKNLFKVVNNEVSNMNSSSSDHQQQQQQFNNSSSATNNNNPRSFMHRSSENQYLLREHQQSLIELNKPELALHYPPQIPQYSLFQPQTLIPPHYSALASDAAPPPPIMVKQLMSNPRDCESRSESLRYQAPTGCEPGLEVGTCEPVTVAATTLQMVGRDHDHHQGLNDWSSMLDQDHHHATASSAHHVHQINQLSLRGEMNFWGYEK